MPTITINQGDTLSAIAQKHGTSVAELVSANKGNAAVKSADLIIAGGTLNLPETVTTPATGPATESNPGSLGGEDVQNTGSKAVGDLGNLRMALRTALNEAAKQRISNSYQQLAPLAGGVPGTIGSVVNMIREGVKAPVETTFSDIITGYKEAASAQEKEKDRINELRAKYGSAVPSNVKDLDTALNLVAPLVDKENKLRLAKMAAEQAADNDVESWATSFAKGEILIGNVPSGIRTQVKVRADKIKEELETQAKQEYKDRIAFRVERKTSNYDAERTLVLQDDNLSVIEQREILDYIDGLEQEKKGAKGGTGTKSFTQPFSGATIPEPKVEPLKGLDFSNFRLPPNVGGGNTDMSRLTVPTR